MNSFDVFVIKGFTVDVIKETASKILYNHLLRLILCVRSGPFISILQIRLFFQKALQTLFRMGNKCLDLKSCRKHEKVYISKKSLSISFKKGNKMFTSFSKPLFVMKEKSTT